MTTAFTPANSAPIFQMDLDTNGGKLAPVDMESFASWIQHQVSAWHWTQGHSFGNHESVFRDRLNELARAQARLNDAIQHRESSPDNARNYLNSAQESVRSVYVDHRLPHTSTPAFKRIESIRSEHGAVAASFYAAALIDQSNSTFTPAQLPAWKGFMDALVDRFGPIGPTKAKVKAVEGAIDELRGKLEATIGDRSIVLDELHRNYESVTISIAEAASNQTKDFGDAQEERAKEFAELTQAHATGMEVLRKTFREELALRAPAEYWTSKRRAHRFIAAIAGLLSFAGIVACALFLANEIQSLLASTQPGATPDHWRIALLALVAVFAVWGVRLIVRIFLSHMHLAGDASERVVMLHTYLSLIEGGQLSEDGERKLILNALFRPASDGIVKDEGVPPSFLDVITRTPR